MTFDLWCHIPEWYPVSGVVRKNHSRMSHDLIPPMTYLTPPAIFVTWLLAGLPCHTPCHIIWWSHPLLSHDLMTTPPIVTRSDDHTLYCHMTYHSSPIVWGSKVFLPCFFPGRDGRTVSVYTMLNCHLRCKNGQWTYHIWAWFVCPLAQLF